MAVDHWRVYLQNDEFIVHTDQRSLIHLEDQRLATPWQQKIMAKMLGLRYRIVYKRGIDNPAADALSRKPGPPQGGLAAITIAVPTWLEVVQQGYTEDPAAQKILARLATSTSNLDGFHLQNGIIKQHGRIWLGDNVELQKQVLAALHTGAIGGHSGFNVTYHRVRRFTWPGLKHHVKLFVEACQICKQAKPERVRYPGLLEPLPVPTQAWQLITMDFMEGLPRSSGCNSILVVVDKFSRYAHFIPLSHPFTAFQVAQAFVTNIYKLHGLPESIVSDRDPVFTSTLCKELFRLTHTKLRMSTARHPQTDGQTEWVNQCLETFLRCFVHACPTKWYMWLPLAEFWYNTSPHSALGTSPFGVLYGHAPRHFGIVDPVACASTDLADWLQDRAQMTTLIHQHLLRARQQMKDSADKRCSDRVFAVDDWVF
uniref:Integrase catalytic domain-containing protein n=1 Tax=Triticum urartu TaxID=4572 RepID=A0A8R7P7T8_TRIUA